MIKIFCDIGGTHIRFAHELPNGQLTSPFKNENKSYNSLLDAIEKYCASQGIVPDHVSHFYFAYSHRKDWDMSPDKLRGYLGFANILKVNDFEANAYGIACGGADDFELLNAPQNRVPPKAQKIVMGVGTGLGTAFINTAGIVQATHGGHMHPSTQHDSHRAFFDFIKSEKTDGQSVIYEDALTGAGLYKIYKYLCAQNHQDIEFRSIEDLMQNGIEHPIVQSALNMFHEILGVYAHHALAFSYGYAGIYLTGGMIDRLRRKGALDAPTIEKFMNQPLHPVVMEHVAATKIFWVKDEFISLKGLQSLANRTP